MPYTRKGKCVYNKETDEKKGCSASVDKAKDYLKALYASEIKEYLLERKKPEGLTDDEIEKVNYYFRNAVEKNHKNFVKNYGPDADKVAYRSAVKKATKKDIVELVLNELKKDQDGDGDKDFADVMVSRMIASGKSKKDAIKATKNKKYNKESLGEGGEGRTENYMFFSNLKQMKRQIEILMEMDPMVIEALLQNGHDWADDHITEAKTNMDQVFDFIMNETE
jgi:hypothetical protein